MPVAVAKITPEEKSKQARSRIFRAAKKRE
jgi:hypothetical protein